MTSPRILVVDDDTAITSLLGDYLRRFRFEVVTAVDGAAMREQLQRHAIDLIVLDVMLPGENGLALAQQLRAQSRVPFILLSAQCSAYDRVIGLEVGADDFLGKPFEPRELVARIHTVLRRGGAASEASDVVRFDGWELQRNDRRLISPTGVVVPLSNAEFKLLSIFLGTPRRVFSRDQLMAQARGRTLDALGRSIDLLVSRLRQKLAEGAEGAPLIRTVRGAGYLFDAQSVRGQPAWH
jgi:two-component system OmpR family response regulator